MTKTPLRFVALSTLLIGLVACQPTTIDPNKDDNDQANVAKTMPTKPLPMIASSKIYRCDDSSVVRVDYMTDGVTANLKNGDATIPKQLVASEKGKPFTAEGGYSLDGDGNTVKLATPGHKSQTCRA